MTWLPEQGTVCANHYVRLLTGVALGSVLGAASQITVGPAGVQNPNFEQLAVAGSVQNINKFKQVNDIQGHARGDKLLQQVSETIIHAIRKTDIAGRIGGDEFTICFPETGDEQVRLAIKKLVQSLDIMTSQSGWQVTASIGVISCKEICETYDALLGKADKLMYVAKKKGKNAAEFCTL